MFEVIITKGELYDKCENIEQLYDKFYYPLLVEYKELKNQQKEFINYLEEKIKYFKDLEQFAIKIFNNKAVINLDLIKRNIEEDNLLICNFEEILQKYKEIIGDDK